jgi:hypothetical protein
MPMCRPELLFVSASAAGAVLTAVVCVVADPLPAEDHRDSPLSNPSRKYVPAGSVPVPLSASVWGLPGALSVTDSDALRVPDVRGENVRLMVQLAWATMVAGLSGHVLVCANSPAAAPVSPMLVMLRAAVPVLVSVTVCPALVELTA